ncbi:TlpA disulfide reductase family protein [Castellaniella sp.]|uniref:TlpA family protein disulfide reductase n=1 Tax=Castellaniella sp. TaxID=1955812 RepID=UPI002AFE1991|nr:TlpA disulfide reductase family protein [Castellaniella sp.]
MNRRLFLHAASTLILGALAAPALARAALLPADPVFGRTFDDLQGVGQALSAYVGRPVVFNFWASWCAPCVREMPLLEALHHQHPDLALVGLAVDTRANVVRFLDKVQVSYPVLLTGTQGIPLMRELGNKSGGLPFTAFYDRDGHLVSAAMGELKHDDLQARIDKILEA